MATDFEKLMTIFHEAVEKHAPGDWDGFVKQAAGNDDVLCQQVHQLLHAHSSGDSLIDKPAISEPTIDCATQCTVGTQIGPYKIREELGEGGMGVVYVAEQTEPVKRKVALKIIKPGMDSRQT